MKNLDLVHAFSLLVQEELQALINTHNYSGWTIFDMGRAPDDEHSTVVAVFQVRIRLPQPPGFEEELNNPWKGREHWFRVETWISDGLVREEFPWERGYVGKPHVVLSVYHSRVQHSVNWLPGLKKPVYSDPVGRKLMEMNGELALHDVCKRIVWHIEDPKCQEGLADRLHRAFGIYLMTQKTLPDH